MLMYIFAQHFPEKNNERDLKKKIQVVIWTKLSTSNLRGKVVKQVIVIC